MSEETILMHCSPVLAGIKTANLLNYRCESCEGREEILHELKRLNLELSEKGIRVIPLSFHGNRVLIYVFRPSCLRRDLSCTKARRILRRCGYTPAACRDPLNHQVMHLMRRISERGEFPHEIGLFLGYPADDVEGFIENRGKNYKCCGFWKVYGDEEKAKELFRRYEDCRRCCLDSCRLGMSLRQLAAADQRA